MSYRDNEDKGHMMFMGAIIGIVVIGSMIVNALKKLAIAIGQMFDQWALTLSKLFPLTVQFGKNMLVVIVVGAIAIATTYWLLKVRKIIKRIESYKTDVASDYASRSNHYDAQVRSFCNEMIKRVDKFEKDLYRHLNPPTPEVVLKSVTKSEDATAGAAIPVVAIESDQKDQGEEANTIAEVVQNQETVLGDSKAAAASVNQY